MRLAGIETADEAVLELALIILRRGGFVDIAESLEGAVAADLPDVGLTILEREAVLWVLDDPPANGLAEFAACCSQSMSSASARGSASRKRASLAGRGRPLRLRRTPAAIYRMGPRRKPARRRSRPSSKAASPPFSAREASGVDREEEAPLRPRPPRPTRALRSIARPARTATIRTPCCR